MTIRDQATEEAALKFGEGGNQTGLPIGLLLSAGV
jgi:hypothetical protein